MLSSRSPSPSSDKSDSSAIDTSTPPIDADKGDAAPRTFSPIKLPIELWREVILVTQSSKDINSLSRTCKGLRTITADVNLRAEYILRSCMPCEAIFQASLRPDMFNEELLETLLSQGAVLSRYFVQAFVQRFFAHTRRIGGASWLSRMKFSGAAALMKIANQKFSEGINPTSHYAMDLELYLRGSPELQLKLLIETKLAPIFPTDISADFAHTLVKSPEQARLLHDNGFRIKDKLLGQCIDAALLSLTSTDNNEQVAFDRLCGMAKYFPGFEMPLDIVKEVVLAIVKSPISPTCANREQQAILDSNGGIANLSSRYKAFKRFSHAHPDLTPMEDVARDLVSTFSKGALHASPASLASTMVALLREMPSLDEIGGKFAALTVLCDFEKQYIHGYPSDDGDDRWAIFDATHLERLHSRLESLKVGLEEAIDLLVSPHTFTHAICTYILNHLGKEKGIEAVDVVKTALRKCIVEPMSGNKLPILEMTLERSDAEQNPRSILSSLLADALAEWRIDLDRLASLTAEETDVPVRTPLAWISAGSCSTLQGSSLEVTKGMTAIQCSIGRSTTRLRSVLSFYDFRQKEKAASDRDLSDVDEKESRSEQEPHDSGFWESPNDHNLPRAKSPLTTEDSASPFPSRCAHARSPMIHIATVACCASCQAYSHFCHAAMTVPFYEGAQDYFPQSHPAMQDIILAHAIINQKEDTIRRLLDGGCQLTMAHFQILAQLGRCIPAAVRTHLVKGAPFRQGKVDSPMAKYRYNEGPTEESKGKDDSRMDLLFAWRDRVEAMDLACTANKVLLRESFRVKKQRQQQLEEQLNAKRGALDTMDDDDGLFLPTAAARKQLSRKAGRRVRPLSTGLEAANKEPKTQEGALRKQLPRRSTANVNYATMLNTSEESENSDSEDESLAGSDKSDLTDPESIDGSQILGNAKSKQGDIPSEDEGDISSDSGLLSEVDYEDSDFFCDEILSMSKGRGKKKKDQKATKEGVLRRHAKWFRNLSTDQLNSHLSRLDDNLNRGLRKAQQSVVLHPAATGLGDDVEDDKDVYGFKSSDGPLLPDFPPVDPPYTSTLRRFREKYASGTMWLAHLKTLMWFEYRKLRLVRAKIRHDAAKNQIETGKRGSGGIRYLCENEFQLSLLAFLKRLCSLQRDRETLLAKELHKRKLEVAKERREEAKKEAERRNKQTKSRVAAKRGKRKSKRVKKPTKRESVDEAYSDEDEEQDQVDSYEVAGHLGMDDEGDDGNEEDEDSKDGVIEDGRGKRTMRTRSQARHKKGRKATNGQDISTAAASASSGRKRRKM